MGTGSILFTGTVGCGKTSTHLSRRRNQSTVKRDRSVTGPAKGNSTYIMIKFNSMEKFGAVGGVMIAAKVVFLVRATGSGRRLNNQTMHN